MLIFSNLTRGRNLSEDEARIRAAMKNRIPVISSHRAIKLLQFSEVQVRAQQEHQW